MQKDIQNGEFPSYMPRMLLMKLLQIEAQAEHFNRLHPDATSATPIIVNPFAIFRPLSMPPPSLPPLHVKNVSAETQALMNSITGLGYGPSSNPLAPPPSRHIPCQYPGILQIAKFVSCDTDDEENHTMDEDNEVGERKTCAFRFKRIYDLERHLKSAHGVYVELESLTRWVEKAEERE